MKKELPERSNFTGSLTFIACLLQLLSGFSLLQIPGTPDSIILLLFAAGIVAGIIFILLERATPDPLFSQDLLQNRNFLYGILASLIVTMLFSGVTYMMPLYLVNSRHLDHATAGLIMTMPALLLILVAPLAGSPADRHGSIGISAIATGLAAAGFLVFFYLQPDDPACRHRCRDGRYQGFNRSIFRPECPAHHGSLFPGYGRERIGSHDDCAPCGDGHRSCILPEYLCPPDVRSRDPPGTEPRLSPG